MLSEKKKYLEKSKIETRYREYCVTTTGNQDDNTKCAELRLVQKLSQKKFILRQVFIRL